MAPRFTPRLSGERFARRAVIGLVAALALGATAARAPEAGAAPTTGQALLAEGRYAEARGLLEAESAAAPDDMRLLRDLAIARLHAGEVAAARADLRRAASAGRLDRDAATRYFLGVALERSDSLRDALAEYVAASGLAPDRVLARRIRARVDAATRLVLEAEARAAVADEERLDVAAIPENTLGVLGFTNAARSERLAPLSTGLTAMLSTDLAHVRALRLVEREKLPVILAELNLAQRAEFDQATAARLGRLLGARRLIKGLFRAPDESTLEVETTLIERGAGGADGASAGAVAAEGPGARGRLDDLFRLEKRLVLDVVASLGISLSPRERREIEKAPTRSLTAFLAFSRGLELEDGGDLIGAAGRYREALGIDPDFAWAQERLDVVEGRAENFASLDLDMAAAGGRGRAIVRPLVEERPRQRLLALGRPRPRGAAAAVQGDRVFVQSGRLFATNDRTSEAFLPDFEKGAGWNARLRGAGVIGCPQCDVRISTRLGAPVAPFAFPRGPR